MAEGRREVLINFRATPAERRELKLLARAEGTTQSEIIRRAIRSRAEAVTRQDR